MARKNVNAERKSQDEKKKHKHRQQLCRANTLGRHHQLDAICVGNRFFNLKMCKKKKDDQTNTLAKICMGTKNFVYQTEESNHMRERERKNKRKQIFRLNETESQLKVKFMVLIVFVSSFVSFSLAFTFSLSLSLFFVLLQC